MGQFLPALAGVPYQLLVFELASPKPPLDVITNGYANPNETGTLVLLVNGQEKHFLSGRSKMGNDSCPKDAVHGYNIAQRLVYNM